MQYFVIPMSTPTNYHIYKYNNSYYIIIIDKCYPNHPKFAKLDAAHVTFSFRFITTKGTIKNHAVHIRNRKIHYTYP